MDRTKVTGSYAQPGTAVPPSTARHRRSLSHYIQRRRPSTKSETKGRSLDTVLSSCRNQSSGPTGTQRVGANVLKPQHLPPDHRGISHSPTSQLILPRPLPGHSCTHKSGTECGTQGRGEGCWPRARAKPGHGQQGDTASGRGPAGGAAELPAEVGAQWAREQWRLPFKYFKITYKGRIKRSEIPFNRTNKEITIYSISLEKASWIGFFPL